MSDTPQTIDEILDEYMPNIRVKALRAEDFDLENMAHALLNRERVKLKQAIKEEILTEVIGEDKHYKRIETPAGSFTCENCGVYTGYPDDCECEAKNELRGEQRHRLDAWLGLEDTSNE